MNKKLFHPDIVLVRLKVYTGQEVERNFILDSIHHPGCKEGHTVLFFE